MPTGEHHWQTIYQTKQPDEVSWTQEIPQISLDFVHELRLPHSAHIIDIGGGDGRLVDCLLDDGFENITVLDISEEALLRAKRRLGDRASQVRWVVGDVLEFQPTMQYDLWHDRAMFHFLTNEAEIRQYLSIAHRAIADGGHLVVGTFSTDGPKKCSGLDIKQYSQESLAAQLVNYFTKIGCTTEDHRTPFNTVQNFLFCSFRK